MREKKRKILFVTERRADYSRLGPIMRGVHKSKRLTLQLVVTGTHLLKAYGNTSALIRKEGFHIDASIRVLHESDADDGASMAPAFGL